MNGKPFFSVVLPTLNRADYISYAIQSVLNQTHTDFELIVSDNSSTDTTEEVVKGFTDSRLKYFKTNEILPMYDSWEFALERAGGEYITFLGDDDAYSAIYLESLKQIIDRHPAQIISCRMANYYYQPADSNRSEYLATPAFTGELTIYDTRELIRNIYIENRLCAEKPTRKAHIPQLINTVYHNTVLSEIRKNIGRVFPKVLAGDYYLAAVALSFADHYYYLDAPLSFHGISPNSTTSSITNMPQGAELKKKQPELAVFQKTPIKDIYVPYNFVADALLLAKADIKSNLDYFEIDLIGYFTNIYYNFYFLELRGHDTIQERKSFTSALEALEPNLQRQIKSSISNKKNLIKNRLQINPRTNAVYQFLRNVRHLKASKQTIITSKKAGFKNIVECAEFVGHRFLKDHLSKV